VLLYETESGQEGLETIEEDTEEEIFNETIGFDYANFETLASSISAVLQKMKKIIGMFNCSNDLTRDLREAQKGAEQFDLIGEHFNQTKPNSVLNLIQDIITRLKNFILI
jgi:hypothetical protein